MLNYRKRHWALAAALATLAGAVDAIGYITLGGFFVAFMSGNFTRLAVGLVTDLLVAFKAASLIAAFLVGVVGGSLAATASGSRRKPVVLLLMSALLWLAAGLLGGGREWPALLMATAMGTANNVFQRNGEVSIPLTYMTGTLVKFGQSIAAALIGGARWTWFPHLLLLLSLTSGSAIGAAAYHFFGVSAIEAVAALSMLLALYAAAIGPAGDG